MFGYDRIQRLARWFGLRRRLDTIVSLESPVEMSLGELRLDQMVEGFVVKPLADQAAPGIVVSVELRLKPLTHSLIRRGRTGRVTEFEGQQIGDHRIERGGGTALSELDVEALGGVHRGEPV